MNNSGGNLSDDKPMAKVFLIFSQIVMFFFGIPFAAFGIFAFCDAWKNVHWATPNPKHNPIATIIFGLIFCAFGLGIMVSAVTAGSRKKKAEESFSKQTDGGTKPWLMRADWAAGKIKSTAGAQVKLFAIMALAFGSFGGLFAFTALPKELHKGNYPALLGLIFPAIGIGFLIAIVRAVRAHRRFGDCFFELAQIPAPLGGSLDGMIQTGARIRLEQGLHLKLSCIRRVVTDSGKNQSTQETILWQDEKILSPNANLPEPEPGHSGIPVFFKLPADQPESYARGRESVFWRLEAKAKMSGPNFFVMFDVPVFQVVGDTVAETDKAAANESDSTAALQESVEEIRRDENSKIKITEGPNGHEFYFPPARNLGMTTFTTFIFLIFLSMLYVLIVHINHFSKDFEIELGLFMIFLGFFNFSFCLKSSRVTVHSGGVSVTKRWLFFPRSPSFSADEIQRFETKVGMTSGNQAYQDIKLVTKNSDSSYTLASGLASKPEADWLVCQMTKALGREP